MHAWLVSELLLRYTGDNVLWRRLILVHALALAEMFTKSRLDSPAQSSGHECTICFVDMKCSRAWSLAGGRLQYTQALPSLACRRRPNASPSMLSAAGKAGVCTDEAHIQGLSKEGVAGLRLQLDALLMATTAGCRIHPLCSDGTMCSLAT